MSNKKSTFVSFMDNNEELAERYEASVGEDIWSLPIQEIETLVSIIANKLKIGFSSVLNNCINMAIQSRTSLVNVLNDLGKTDEFVFDNNNSLQKYFQEINKIYTKNNNDYDIPFCEENREKIISMNLKSVIAIAKCYQGLGLDFEDLIGAGNEGLCHAFNKYDPKRACLKDIMIEAVNNTTDETLNDPTKLSYDAWKKILDENIKYGETLKKELDKRFKEGEIYDKEYILKWIDKNIMNAKFNSVACKWIKAFIMQEINNNSRMVKKPKSQIDKDKEETGTYQREVLVNIDAPLSNDERSNTLGDMLVSEDESIDRESLENEENYKVFKENLNKLLVGVKSRDRRILLKKFGIGVIRPLQPNEIAQQENLSVARISQIIGATIEIMIANAKRFDIDEANLFGILEKLV